MKQSLARLLISASALFATIAQAQDVKSVDANRAYLDARRVGRVFTADVGGGYSSGPTRFAKAGVYVNPDWVIEGYYEESRTWFFGRLTSRGVRSRNFWNANLYTNAGIIQRRVSGRNMFLDMASSTFSGVDTRYEIKYWDIGPEFAVGSQWQWSAFQAGIDWAGIYWPVYASAADITRTENDVVTTKRANDDIEPEPSARLLRVYVGFSI